jgi:hypothetical protein
MHLCFKIVKFLLQSMSLYMFRTLLCPLSGAFDFKTEVHLGGFYSIL